ncbi:MAG: preprotein translocase subunit SecE [Aeriscardovia sp.]|nr:preprotein translocase subunit SecE [Aeriscardovia sp.]MBQ9687993.1 preprotein translocase subunit SecE [Aeriscardovia sp.]MBR2553331.1 preprotein translocase subunit SecE [Aeriscardovia sp.]MBR4414038.1 preprotein translocase subunit SecE [Aeriscardovia sp.]
MNNESKSEESKMNFFTKIGLFIRQIIAELRKVVAPTRKGLFNWVIAVLIFVILLMLFVTAIDFGMGKLVLLVFG